MDWSTIVANVLSPAALFSLGSTEAATSQSTAEDHARRIMDHLGYVGVMTIEYLEVDGRLLVNELAPRVHNSGRWTIEGA